MKKENKEQWPFYEWETLVIRIDGWLGRNIAMTGEMTLSGNILKIGMLKEKLIAAYNAKIKKVYIPKANEADLDDIPDLIKNKMEIKLVSDYIEIYNDLF